jgi:hypothetical protein
MIWAGFLGVLIPLALTTNPVELGLRALNIPSFDYIMSLELLLELMLRLKAGKTRFEKL